MVTGQTPSPKDRDRPPVPRRILIIGIDYAPDNAGIAPYTTGLARHLAARSWQVTVITGMPYYPQWRVRPEDRRTLRRREMQDGVEVRRFRHHVPSSQSALGRGLYEATFFLNALSATGIPRPDCILGVVPSLSGGAIAARQARRFGVPFGLIVQDLMAQAAAQSGMPGGGAAVGTARALECWAARRAAGVGIVAKSFGPHLERAGVASDRIFHLPNWSHVTTPTGKASEVREALGWADQDQIVLHAGNMGYKQGLRNVVDTARLASAAGSRLQFVLMGDGNDRRRLEELGAGIPNLVFLDPQPADIFMDVLAAADILLVNENRNVRDMSLPSKITSYYRAGRPVVAAVRDDGSTAAELAGSGGAVIVPPEDAPALLAALERLVGDTARQEQLTSSALSYASVHLDRSVLLQRAERFVAGLADSPQREGAMAHQASE